MVYANAFWSTFPSEKKAAWAVKFFFLHDRARKQIIERDDLLATDHLIGAA